MKLKIFGLLSLTLLAFIAMAQEGGGFKITKSTIDNGGGVTAGAGYKMTGTTGQSDASVKVTGGGYQLTGGFWTEGVRPESVFKDGFES